MIAFRQSAKAAILVLTVLFIVVLKAYAGPPFQTDDPEPVDFRHYELYAFGNAGGTGVEMDTAGPAIEFNWGVLPNTQFHIVIPADIHHALQQPEISPRWRGTECVWHWRY